MEQIRHGTVKEKKEAIKNITSKEVKTLINVIGNVLDDYQYDMMDHLHVLRKFTSTFMRLLDKEIPLYRKKSMLQRQGYKYLPIFLEIIGEDLEPFEPKERKRRLKDCPVCGKERLKRLANHLREVHKITDRRELLQQATLSE